MPLFKCKMCGGDLEIKEGMSVAECQYCGTQQTLPRLDSDRRANLYDRANHFRRNNEYDKAMSIYEQILNEDSTDAEAYWSLVLCRYGIEYVEDPATHKRVPTVNRAQFTSIFADEDYKQAIAHADGAQRAVYEAEAKAIDDIQKRILEISSKEEPFDVFICYKETDNNGRRTPDSVLANDLYHQLTQEGFKVFFSRITLEDKLGTAYEPYIFAALNSAKVMVVLGTRPEYFNAVWVKNEWSRYLALIKNGAKKVLIPAYRDMDPYDLPEEFSHLQAQDMSKLGFMQDLIRGIKKLTETDEPHAVVKETAKVNTAGANIAPLLKRAFMFLEDGDWQSADEYCERVLDTNPECAQAYLGKLMAELQVHRQEKLADCAEPFDKNGNYQKAVRFADEKLAAALKGYIAHINERNESQRLMGIYNNSVTAMQTAETESEFKATAEAFRKISNFKDADELAKQCMDLAEKARKNTIYNYAITAAEETEIGIKQSLENALELFRSIPGWQDADEQAAACERKIEELKADEEAERITEAKRRKRNKKIGAIVASAAVVCIAVTVVINIIIPNIKYNEAMQLFEQSKYEQAAGAFLNLDGYKDSENMALYNQAKQFFEQGEYEKATDIFNSLTGFKDSDTMQNRSKYMKAMQLKANGDQYEAAKAFYAIGDFEDAKKQCFELWDKITFRETISAGDEHTIGLTSSGNVIATEHIKDPYFGTNGNMCNTSHWSGIIAASAGDYHSIGLRADGSVVVSAAEDFYGQSNVSDWTDIVAISGGMRHTVGLKADGTVVATRYTGTQGYYHGQCDVSEWNDIVAISAGSSHTVGLKADGTVVATRYTGTQEYYHGQCDVSEWNDIVAISAGSSHTVGLKADGTVIAVGYNVDGQCDVSEWTDVIAISAGENHTVGLKADGTVVATNYKGDKDQYCGECNISGWSNIVAISAGAHHTVGLKSDGTVVTTNFVECKMYRYNGQCDVSEWTNIKLP